MTTRIRGIAFTPADHGCMLVRMTYNQRRVLELASNGESLFSGAVGMSQHGGRQTVITSCIRRSWLNQDDKITVEGLAALRQAKTT